MPRSAGACEKGIAGYFTLNVMTTTLVEAGCKGSFAQAGRIDVAINNAGYGIISLPRP